MGTWLWTFTVKDQVNMKTFITLASFALFVVAVTAKRGGGKQKPRGRPGGKPGPGGEGKEESCWEFDPMEVGRLCVVGTEMGAKIETAVEECYNVDTGAAEGRARPGNGKKPKKPKPSEGGRPGKKPGKGGKPKPSEGAKPGKGGKKPKPGKGGKRPCLEFDDLVSEIRSKFADEICFLDKMGWVENELEWNEDTFVYDMSSLNSELKGKINQTAIDDCAEKMTNKIVMMGKKCSDNYTDEQNETLLQIGQFVAHGTCGHEGFEKACGEYVKEGFETYMHGSNQMTVGK